MMRNKKYCILLLTAALAGTTACYKDLSTPVSEEMKVIDSPHVDSVITAAYGTRLVFDPQIARADGTSEGLEFKWELNIKPNSWTMQEYGEEPVLELDVLQSPNDEPYMIRLRVTDSRDDMIRLLHWPLYVSNPFGEGLLVAHTHDGGQTSDIDLVAAQSVTYGYQSLFPSYTRNIWSLANGEALDGRIQAMETCSYSVASAHDRNAIIIGTDKEIIGLEPTTFKPSLHNEQFFTLPVNDGIYSLEKTYLVAGQDVVMLMNGRLYVLTTKMTSTFSQVTYQGPASSCFTPKSVTGGNKTDQNAIYAYDHILRQFVTCRGWNLFQSMLSTFSDIYQLPENTELVASGEMDGYGAFIMKENGAYKVYYIRHDNDYVDYETFDISEPELDNAVSFAFCDNTPIMFFTNGRKISSIIMTHSGTTVRNLSWKPDSADERITSLMQYRQAWYAHMSCFDARHYSFILPNHRTQLLITTYNEKTGEGKIYVRPFNVSTGLFTMKDGGTFGGFGEILAIMPTNR